MTKRESRFDIRRVDVEAKLSSHQLRPDADGLALEVFRNGVVVGFAMHAAERGSRINAARLRRWAEEAVAQEAEAATAPLRCDEAPLQPPGLTIAICTRNHADLLARCLDGLSAAAQDAFPVEILIVDNAPSDESTESLVRARTEIRYVREEMAGLNFARNRALRECSHPLLAFIDDDVVVDPGWLAGFASAFRRAPDARAFAGQVLPFELETPAQVLIERMGGFRKGFAPIVYGQQAPRPNAFYPLTADYGTGCNMAFDVATLRALGGFDEALDMGAYLSGGGDLEVLYRVVRQGHRLVYDPAMLVRHQHRRDMAGLYRQARRSWGAGTMAFLCKVRDSDPEMRARARTFIRWWFRDALRRVVRCRNGFTPEWRVRVEELRGMTEGLFGLYGRASRRAASIRAAHGRG